MSKRILIIIISSVFIVGIIVGYLGCYFFEVPMSNQMRNDYIEKAVDYELKANRLIYESDAIWSAVLKGTSYELEYNAPSITKQKLDLASQYRQQALKYRELAAK